MYCENCGAKIGEGKNFCKECGAPAPQPDIRAENLNKNDQINNEPSQSSEQSKDDALEVACTNTETEQTLPVNYSQKSGYYSEPPVTPSKKENVEKAIFSNNSNVIIVAVIILIIVLLLFFGLWESNKTRQIDTPTDTAIETTTLATHQLFFDIESTENIFFSTYDIEIFLDDEKLGNISNGGKYTSLNVVDEGEHQIHFYKNGEHNVSATETININQNSLFKCTLSSKNNSIIVTNTELTDFADSGKIVVVNVTNMNLSEAISLLRNTGFEIINYISEDDSLIINESDWTVISQNIEAGTLVDNKTEIILVCKSNSETDISVFETTSASLESTEKSTEIAAETTTEKRTMFYSTNDLKNAKKGNKGVFAYRQNLNSYSNYVIIDFDNGVVYSFSDDEKTAVKCKIVSGDLNTQLEYRFPGESDIYWVHFRFKERPDRLYLGSGDTLIADDFYATDLNDALRLLNNRAIV